MSDVQHYLIEVTKNKPEARRIAEDVGRKLASKEVQLLEVIESIGEYVNNEDATLRRNSLAFLADVLDSLPSRTLSLQHRTLLTEFVLSRIQDDSEGIGACARALLALEQAGRWDPETSKKIMTTLIEGAHPLKDTKLQTDRYAVLQVIDLLFAKYREPINAHAEGDYQFVERLTSFFEGEKDPRNLMLVFSIVLVPMSEWDLGPSTQDMFELAFNYFPITFKPPPGDPFKITAQDLKDRLRACIASTSDFALYSIPALLDKLDSSSMNTKRDVLQALIASLETFEPPTISLYAITLWDALKFEILNVQEDDLAEGALDALALMARKLPLASDGALHNYLKPIVKECNEHFEDAPTRQSEAAGKILNAVAKASPAVADNIVKGVVPSLLVLFQNSDSIAKRRGLIEGLNKLIDAVQYTSSDWQERDAEGNIVSDHASSNALRTVSKDLVEIMLQAVTTAPKSEVSFRLVCINGLQSMLQIRQLVPEADAARIVSAATEIIIKEIETTSDEVKVAAIGIITGAARFHTKATVEIALPALLAELPDAPEAGTFAYEPALEALARLTVEPSLADTIVIRLKNKINAARHAAAPQSYILAMLMALLFVFSSGQPARDDGIIRLAYLTDNVLPLLEDGLGLGTAADPVLSSEAVIDILGRITNIILREQSAHNQNRVFASVERVFDSLRASQEIPEYSISRPSSSRLGIIASMYLHAAFRPEIYQNGAAEPLISTLVGTISQDDNTTVVQSNALRHLMIVINKFVPPSQIETLLEHTDPELTAILPPRSARHLQVAFAITKGLLVTGKNAKLSSRYLQSLLSVLATADFGETAATGIGQLLAPDELLTKENHCSISGLYRQRTYNTCLEAISAGAKTDNIAVRKKYLIALCGLLKSLPYDIVKSTLPAITPLLLQAVDIEDKAHQQSIASAYITLEAVLLYDPDNVSEHASALINRLLSSSQARDRHEDIRVAALRCLKLLPAQLKREVAIPFRRQVTAKLVSCLDDRRRAVRAEAVRARAAWIGLDQEGKDD